jgi:undecaprenyl-phosphate galactose phosphotransferase
MGPTQNQAVYEGSLAAGVLEYGAFEREVFFEELDYLDAPTNSWQYRVVKRFVDIVAALMMLLIFIVPGLMIAAAIVLTSKGSVFYRETRIGRDGKPFRIWKFRSMYQDAAERAHIASASNGSKVLQWRMSKHLQDPRITAIGGFLRKWSIDEVPQCLNVLSGDMSLIGPRPIVEAEAHLFGDLLDYYKAAKPGLSGLWQVSGRSNVDYKKRAMLDATYVMTWSLRSDFSLVFRTIPAVLQRVGAR